MDTLHLPTLEERLNYRRFAVSALEGAPAGEERYYTPCLPRHFGRFDWDRFVWLIDPNDFTAYADRHRLSTDPARSGQHTCLRHGTTTIRPLSGYVAPWTTGQPDDTCGDLVWHAYLDQTGQPHTTTHAAFISRQRDLDHWVEASKTVPDAERAITNWILGRHAA